MTFNDADDVIRQRLLAIIRKHSTISEFGENPRLFHDLKLRGDDAKNFLDEVASAFDTDFSEFEFREFFPDEYYSIRDMWNDFWGVSDTRWKVLSLDHLTAVCAAGRWFDAGSQNPGQTPFSIMKR